MPSHRWMPGLLAGVALATSAQAEPLTFGQALDRARANAPSLEAGALQVQAARSSAQAAGTLPDPQLKAGIDNFPITGPNAGRIGADEMTMGRVGIVQEVPNRARRRAEEAVARADISVAEDRVRLEARVVRISAALAWIDLYYAEQRLAALDGVLHDLSPIWEAAPSGVVSGRARPAAALAPIQGRAKLDDRRSELAAALTKARADLARWTGDAVPEAAGTPPGFDIDPASLRAGLERQPTVAAFDSAARRAEADLALARAAKRPDWSFELAYGRRDPMFGDMVSAGVTVRLPIFNARRYDPVIAARLADASRVRAEREDVRRQLVAALEGDLADHTMHHDQAHRAREVVLPTAQQQADLETASYGAGTASISDVLEAFTSLADAKLDALEKDAMVARDGVRITLTYGGEPS